MKVPILDLKAATAELHDVIEEAVGNVLRSGWYIGGPALDQFERDYAAYLGAEHVVGTANGLDSLRLVLEALGVGAGDEVIVASNSYIATLLAVSALGAQPVLVEPLPDTHNLDPARVTAAITARTRAILPTHLYGQPADLDSLLAIARQHKLFLVEDAAQAHGARYKGARLGAHGDAVCWSFYPSKNLGALGDAGAISTNHPALAQQVRTLGNYGSRTRYYNDYKGLNSRLDPIQAAILSCKLRLLDDWNERRRVIAKAYMVGLRDSSLMLPRVPDFADPAWHQFVIVHDARDELARYLADQGIATLIHYPVPPHLQRAYADLGFKMGAFPIAERLAGGVLSLPIGPHLSLGQADYVIDAVRAFDRAGG